MFYELALLLAFYLTANAVGDTRNSPPVVPISNNVQVPSPTTATPSSAPAATAPTPQPLVSGGHWQGNRFVGQLNSGGNDQPVAGSSHVSVSVAGPSKAQRRLDDRAQQLNSTGERGKQIFEDIFGRMTSFADDNRRERIQQMNAWLSDRDPSGPGILTRGRGGIRRPNNNQQEKMVAAPLVLSPLFSPMEITRNIHNPKNAPFHMMAEESRIEEDDLPPQRPPKERRGPNVGYGSRDSVAERPDRPDLPELDDEPAPTDEEPPTGGSVTGLTGGNKQPQCAHGGRYYCSYKEDYPIKVVSEVARYYKWPLEKLFRDLRQQVMPKLANDNYGGLVCDSVTRVVRPGWARNTNNRWLVVINTENYQQFVTEVVCRNGQNTPCNFVPPCYSSVCTQRYNTQKLLVIDPWNPYKGPFMSEFLFPSCCICYVPSYAASEPIRADQTPASSHVSPFADRQVKKGGGPDTIGQVGKIEL